MHPSEKKLTKCVIYCRVSDPRQVREGDGLNSQETRCREYARLRGLDVVKVFKDAGVSGKFSNRPAIQDMLTFLAAQTEEHIIIVDDISRLARSVSAHIQIKAALKMAGGRLESPSMKFGDEPEDQFVETIMASVAELHRNQNAKQVRNRMRARMLNGYWTFSNVPVGYKWAKDKIHHKILVKDEPWASLVTEALEGFAAGRFATQTDVQLFLQKQKFPSERKAGISLDRVGTILRTIFYAGYLEKADWDVPLTKGKHEPLISIKTYQKIMDKIEGKRPALIRKDIHLDFPLRGFVLCDGCGDTLTSYWGNGRTQRYAYYVCKTNTCPCYNKTIKRDVMETRFVTLLHAATPSPAMARMVEKTVKEVWQDMSKQTTSRLVELENEKFRIERDIQALIDRITQTRNQTVAAAYEGRLEELTRSRNLIGEDIAYTSSVDMSFNGALRTVFDFIEKPYLLWCTGNEEDKKTTLKLVFAKRARHDLNDGFRTAAYSLPFLIMQQSVDNKSGVVENRRVELLTSTMPS